MANRDGDGSVRLFVSEGPIEDIIIDHTRTRPAATSRPVKVRRWDPVTVATLAALLFVDAVFILLYAAASNHAGDNGNWLADPRLRLAMEGSYGEWFGYVKLLFVVTSLWGLYRRIRGLAYLSWYAVFIVVLVDDAFALHERLGRRLAAAAGLQLGLGNPGVQWRAEEAGQLAAWAAVTVLFIAVLAMGHYRSGETVRYHSRRLFLLLLLMGTCAVAMDVVHILSSGYLRMFAAVAEEGGELATISAVAAYVLMLVRRPVGSKSRSA